ncbi:MAG: hypothetical protein LBT15_01915 [Synergistaceae bacterium]|jgi:hypothetical protein|nr:hypothetical protein [Synergistaceae bacterium]
MDVIRERLKIVLETLEGLPYYPWSVVGGVALVLLLLVAALVLGKRSSKKKGRSSSTGSAPRGGRSGVPVRGLAIDGLRGDGDVDMQLVESIKNAPMGRVVLPDTPVEPPRRQVDPALLEQAVKACQDKFQDMYIEMYIGLGLMSDFDQMRTEVSRRVADGQETYHVISEMNMTPEGVVLMQMASVAGSMLQTGEQHIGRGLLGIHGQELFSVYRYALTTLQERGFASVDETQSKLDFMEKKIRELG